MDDSLYANNIPWCEIDINKNEDSQNCIGAYLMRDNDGNLIRSGATADSFYNRMKSHYVSSSLNQGRSRRCLIREVSSSGYPPQDATKDNQRATCEMQKCYWEDITAPMAISWRKENCTSVTELFDFDTMTIEHLSKNKSKLTIEEKKERYLFELVLQLCLKPSDNVSSNPGFESFNGKFASNK